jgi:hypothetical protein
MLQQPASVGIYREKACYAANMQENTLNDGRPEAYGIYHRLTLGLPQSDYSSWW